MKKIYQLSDEQLCQLINNRWNSSSSVWDEVNRIYERNVKVYKSEPEWLSTIPKKKSKVRANQIFVDMESVINGLIAQPPKPNVIPGSSTPEGSTEESRELAMKLAKYLQLKYDERNVKETLRKGLRNLYFARLIVLKKFWDAKINDFNTRAIDPRKVRISKSATKEEETEFIIEEIEDSLIAVMRRFPAKAASLMEKSGFTDEDTVLVENPTIKYKEAWIRDYVCFKYEDIILGKIKNPYWDWDGLAITPEEDAQLKVAVGDARRNLMMQIQMEQAKRKAQQVAAAAAAAQQMGAEVPPTGAPAPEPEKSPLQEGDLPVLQNQDDAQTYQAYFYNHFDRPRKPYIFGTLFNNENTPIGQTDMITQAVPLQENVDETKRDITENAKIMNGVILVDSTVMGKADAQKLRYEVGGIIWGKGVLAGVKRETGPALPAFVVENMIDSRRQIDEIMAASSAFKGNREGQETKAGRLALIQQSFLRLNEMVQLIDYMLYESFNWDYQLMKVKYTEHHFAKVLGENEAAKTITFMRDDFEDGTEIHIIPGKMLPEDNEFKYAQAQKDSESGLLAPIDYLRIAGYDNPKELAKNAYMSKVAPESTIALSEEEKSKIPEPMPETKMAESIQFSDMPPAAKVQSLARIGIKVTEGQVVAAEIAKSVLDGAAKGQGESSPADLEKRVLSTDEAVAADVPTKPKL